MFGTAIPRGWVPLTQPRIYWITDRSLQGDNRNVYACVLSPSAGHVVSYFYYGLGGGSPVVDIYLPTFHNHSKFFMTEFLVSKARAGFTFIAIPPIWQTIITTRTQNSPRKQQLSSHSSISTNKHFHPVCQERKIWLLCSRLPKTPLFSIVTSGQPERTDGFVSRTPHLRVQARSFRLGFCSPSKI